MSKLGSTERENLVHSILELKKKPSRAIPPAGFALPKPTNRYDDFVMMHMISFSRESPVAMIAHRSPTFLPWHRAYLRMFERELQKTKPEYKDVTIPYWDWTNPDKSVWDDTLMGGDGREADGRVTEGSFAYDSGNWELYTAPMISPQYARPDLSRRFGLYMENGQASEIRLPTATQVDDALGTDPYDNPNWNNESEPSFRNKLEGGYGEGQIHNIVHVWVGGMIIQNDRITYSGAMSSGGSPNDPVFWLHHANIDRLWADWQLEDSHWGLEYVGYEPKSSGPRGLNANDPMLPWSSNITPARVSNIYSIDTVGYNYDKYHRKKIVDRVDQIESQNEFLIAPRIGADEILDSMNFSLVSGSFDALLDTLNKPVFPIKITK